MADPADGSDGNLSILNPFPRLLEGPSLLHELITDGSSEATALEYHDASGLVLRLTYSQLHSCADRLSDSIHGLNKSTDTHSPHIIPLLIPQSPALYISQLAILKSGAAFCPVVLDVPEERLRFILQDVNASVVITTSAFAKIFDGIPNISILVLDLDGTMHQQDGAKALPNGHGSTSPRKPSATVATTDPAYIMYTSGSTGTPKAVSVSHRAVTQSLLAHDRYMPHFTRFLQFANPTFDVSVFEIFFPFYREATLVACDRTYLLSDLPNVITKLDVDGAELTPSVVASLVRKRENVPKLGALLTIGEMLNPQTVREFAGSNESESLLYGMYGPTEAAIHCTLQPTFQQDDTVNNIGIPLDTVSCFVVKPVEEGCAPDAIHILPAGQVGELAVGGHQLADGYLNREEQTDAVFVEHPRFRRLYRTGDKARLTSNGTLECLGRISKGQVKLRGQRIELGEVEHAASRLDAVHAASASVLDGQLVLFCVADLHIEAKHIITSCQKWLPRFMVPNEVIILPDFPYLPSGKVDQRKLESDYRSSTEASTDEQMPSSSADEGIVSIVEATLGTKVRRGANLGANGLDSLKAIKLATDLKRAGHPQIDAVSILTSNTVEELSALVSRASETSGNDVDVERRYQAAQADLRDAVIGLPTLSGKTQDIFAIHSCTPIQDAMLVETRKNPLAYSNSATFAISPNVQLPDIKSAFQRLVERHTMLRTGFVQSPAQFSAFAQVTWHSLEDGQLTESECVAGDLELGIEAYLLRPVRIYVHRTGDACACTLRLHHAQYDQWSLDIIADDLCAILQDQKIPERPRFSELVRLAYTNKHSRTKQKDLHSFWKSYMADSVPSRLPNLTGKSTDSTRSSIETRSSTLDLGQVTAAAHRLQVSPSILFQAAYGYLLSLYNGQPDLTFGVVFSGRTAAVNGIEDLVGPLLATLPTRVKTEECPSLHDLIQANHKDSRAILAHTDLPLSDIKRTAGVDASTMLFDSIFVWQGTPRNSSKQTDVRLVETSDYVEYNLILDIEPRKEDFVFKATYRDSVLSEQQMRIFLRQLEAVVTKMMDDSSCLLRDAFADNDDLEVLSVFNPQPQLLDRSGGLGRLLDQAFDKYRNCPALQFANALTEDVSESEILTFGQLDETANRLAHHQLSHGLQPGQLAAVIMEKSANLYVSILAVIKAGCGYLPIVPSTPIQRIQKILAESGVSSVLCDRKSAEDLRNAGVTGYKVVEDLNLSKFPVSRPESRASPSDVAYAVYTSGTTGEPKGILVTHENIVSNLLVLKDIYPVADGSRLLQSCNQAFDVSVFEIFFSWLTGMCLCSANNDILFRDLEKSIRTMQVTHLSMTPTVAALVNPDNVPSVKFLITAGEAVTPQVHRAWAGRDLYQGYGPSETTNICTVNPSVSVDDAINNIGPSFRNTSTFVLPVAGDFAPLPRGALGELCFGGQQVFRGYRNMPDTTAKKVIDHPTYGRIYRSGDLGRLLPNGSIMIEGRIDGQRKIRGQRIELKEIVATMLRCDGVSDAVVLVAGDSGTEKLIGFWIPRELSASDYEIIEGQDSSSKTTRRLKEMLDTNLPSYMVPSALIPISSLPKTGQSKIDTKRLLQDFESLPVGIFNTTESDDFDDNVELSATETALQAIVAETLQISEDSVRRNTSLFGLGLDSISAIKLVAKIDSVMMKRIDISAVLKRPRLSQLTAFVDSLAEAGVETNGHISVLNTFLPACEKNRIVQQCSARDFDIDRMLPCTPLQEAMLSASLGDGASAYLNRTVLKVENKIDDLKSAWTTIAERHDIFRTIFLSTEDPHHPFVQVVLPRYSLQWRDEQDEIDVVMPLSETGTTIKPPVDSMMTPYQLSVRRTPNGAHLVIDMHHVLYDANALSTILAEVQQYLTGKSLPKAPHFDDFLEHMLEQSGDDSEGFFKHMLRGFVPKSIPSSKHQASQASTNGIDIALPTSDLQSFQQKHDVSLLAICQAAWFQVLSVLQDASDMCFGNVVSGRSAPVKDIDRLVAPCFNTIPLRADLSSINTNIDLMKHMHQLNIDSLPHQLTALRCIQQQNSEGKRLFDSLVLLQQAEQQLDPAIWSFVSETGDMDFPCILELVPSETGLSLSLHLQQHTCADSQIAVEICEMYRDTLLTLLRYPLSDFWSSGIQEHRLSGVWKEDPKGNTKEIEDPDKDDTEWSPDEISIRDALLSFSALPAEAVSRHTTIYRMGLDSISAIQAATRLKKSGYTVSASDILEHPTPAELAAFIAENYPERSSSSPSYDFESFSQTHLPAISKHGDLVAEDIESIRPCTAVQSGMLTSFIQSEGRNYLNHVLYGAAKVRNAKDLSNAWRQVISTHEMLRTGFVEIEDRQSSFAMVTFEDQSEPAALAIQTAESTSFEDIQDESRQDVLRQLALPAWRCRIIEQDGRLQMLLSMHHALYDAASLSNILDDLSKALTDIASGKELSINRALSHIRHQEAHNEEDEEFWKGCLADTTPSRFPNLNPVVPKVTGMCDITLDCSKNLAELEGLSGQRDVSLQAVFQLAWAKLLAAYTGEPQVVFGVVQSGRFSEETQDACFPCINTLPLAVNTGRTNDDLLKVLTASNIGLQKHCFTPLSSVQKWAGLVNEALFDTIFAFQKPHSGRQTKSDWTVLRESAAVDYAVSLEVEHLQGGQLRLRATFDSAILPLEQGKVMLQQIDIFVNDLLSSKEIGSAKDKLVSIVQPKTPVIPDRASLLQDLLDDSMSHFPKRVAVEFVSDLDGSNATTQQWTYAQLDEKACQVAHILRKRGVSPGSVVGLSFDKCPEASFAFLGILRAGCCILAVDASAPLARKEFILSDSGAAALLCSASVATELADVDGVVVIDLPAELQRAAPPKPLESDGAVSPQSVCYILYTSGTTGTPKGCEITHENAVQGLLAFQRLFKGRWTDKSVWLQFASYHFDVAILEHFWTWSVGMKMVCAPRDLILEDIAHFIDTFQVTHLDLTPSLGRLLDPASVPSLHSGVFITGGEAVKPEMLQAWGDIGCLFNFYGPTECTIGVTTFPCVSTNGKASNIGWQFDNVGTCVLTPDGDEPVLRGGVGELCIFGKLVGKGYLHRPDLNAKSFPYSERLGQRLYRTGDLVRLLHDDSFEFLGRADGQVKLRGQRLEIDEIVAVMLRCEQVKDAVCIVARQDNKQKDQLVAFLSTSTDRRQGQPNLLDPAAAGIMIGDAKTACVDNLAGYMVPTQFIPVDFIPLSVNNKQDDKLLKQIYQGLDSAQLQELSASSSSNRALTSDEQRIVEALGAVLGTDLENVMPDTNMFALGLSSITAVQLARRIKGAGFKQAKIANVMQNPTIAKLANALSDKTKSSDQTGAVITAKQRMAAYQQKYLMSAAHALDCSTTDIELVAPCTPLQQGILYRSDSSEEGLYFNKFRFEIGDIDLKRLQQAFQELLDTTDILRVAFVETEDGHVQAVRKQVCLDWQVCDADDNDSLNGVMDAAHQEWIEANKEHLVRPFSITTVSTPERCVMQVSIHHALYDGNSWSLVLRKLHDLYEGYASGAKATSFFDALPYGPLQEQQQVQTFWTKHMANASFNILAFGDVARSTKDNLVTRTMRQSALLEACRQKLQVTPQALVQAAWFVTLAKYHSGPAGLVVSGRSIDIDADSIVGPLFNTIPFAWALESSDTWETLAKRCHDFNIESLPYQHTPLRSIAKYLKKTPSEPLFETLFVFQQPQADTTAGDGLFRPLDDAHYTADYPLSFEAEQATDGTLQVSLGAQAEVATEGGLDQMLAEFHQHLEALLQDPSASIVIPERYQKARSGNQARSATKAVNGYHGPFEWTDDAQAIRSELAQLSHSAADDIDEHSSIFSLGLDSIDAVKLSARLKKNGIAVPVSALIRDQTIPRILESVKKTDDNSDKRLASDRAKERQTRVRGAVKRTLGDMSSIEDVLPATPMQEALVAEMISSDYHAYFNHDVMEICAGVDMAKLMQAWKEVITASPILRTAFIAVDDPDSDSTFAQVVIKESLDWQPETVDMAKCCDFETLMEQARTTAAEHKSLAVPFRLTIATKADRTYMVISLAHALYDGYSLGLLHSDIVDAYHNKLRPRPAYTTLIDKAVDATGTAAESSWQSMLTGVQASIVPDTGKPNGTTHRSERSCHIPASKIVQFCKQQGITPQALSQTAWALVLASLSQRLDVVFGSVQAGRNDADAEQMLFPTMNTIVVRVILHSTASELLRTVQSQIVDSMPFQQTPLRRIQQIARQVGKLNSGSLVNTLFTYQKRPQTSSSDEAPLYTSISGSADVDYPLAVEAELVDENLVWRIAAKDSLYDEKETSDVLVAIDDMIRQLVEHSSEDVIKVDGQVVSVFGQKPFSLKTEGHDRNEQTGPAKPEGGEKDWSPKEVIIREAAAQVARVPVAEVTKSARLENLGIDSISVIKLASLLRKQGINLPVSRIIKAGTIATIAGLVSGQGHADADATSSDDVDHGAALLQRKGFTTSIFGLRQDDIESIMPTSAGQVYLLSTWRNSNASLFHPTFSYKLTGARSVESVQIAWHQLVERYSVLRTIFAATGDEGVPYVQAVLKAKAVSNSLAAGQPLAEATFDERQDGIVLKLKIVHALYDAVSLDLMIQDLAALVQGSQGLPTNFVLDKFISRQVSPQSKQKQQDFWTRYLKGSEAASVSAQAKAYGGRRTEVFEPFARNIADMDNKRLRQQGISLQSLFFAAYAQQCADLHNLQEDVVIGVYLANRSHTEELSTLVAPTINLLPLRLRNPSSTTLAELAKQVQQDMRDISDEDHSGAGLWEIKRWTGVTVDTFVNFIKLPEADKSEEGGAVKICSLDDEREFLKRADVLEEQAMNSAIPDVLRREMEGVDEAYPPSLDVEATVRDGKLAIGAFGYDSVVDIDMAQGIVAGLVRRLDNFFGV